MSVFYDLIEQNIADSRGKLIRLIKCASSEVKDLMKNSVNMELSLSY